MGLYHAIATMINLFFLNLVFLFGMYLRPLDQHSQELTGKSIGERRFVLSIVVKLLAQMFIYLLTHAFGIIVFFIWLLYYAIDGSEFGS